ncbi:MAG: tyrosine-type recombinase/integrase [Lachnospiraceae bacterium]|nr:tyrosine-type recombinase/integrase [Lachnospiraceae bacterium]
MQSSDITDQFLKVCAELPPYCRDFFTAKNDQYMPKTKLAYAWDYRIFFYYLVSTGLSNAPSISQVPLSLLDELKPLDISAYMMYLDKYQMPDFETGEMRIYRNSQSGKQRKLASLRAFYKYFQKMDRLKNNPAALVEHPKSRAKEKIVLSDREVALLKEEAATGHSKSPRAQKYHEKTKYRDTAILSLFLGTGLRISELVGIDLFDLDENEQKVLVLRKEGNREFVYFNSTVLSDLQEYIEHERPVLTKTDPEKTRREDGPLFVSNRGTRISVLRVEQIVKEYASFVLPPSVKVTPHALRKTFGTKLYLKYRDLALVQHALGHATPATTERFYTKFDEKLLEALRDE